MAQPRLEGFPEVTAHVNGLHQVFHVEIINGQQEEFENQTKQDGQTDGSQHGGRENGLEGSCLLSCGCGMKGVGTFGRLVGFHLIEHGHDDGDGYDNRHDEVNGQLKNGNLGGLQEIALESEFVEREALRKEKVGGEIALRGLFVSLRTD